MAFYGKHEPGDREQYLRQTLGDDLYEWLEEVSMQELFYKNYAWRCPNCENRVDSGNVEFNHPEVKCPYCCMTSKVPASIMTKIMDQAAEDGRGCKVSDKSNESVVDVKQIGQAAACGECGRLLNCQHDNFTRKICQHCGADNRAWLDNIPDSEFKGRLQAQLKESDPNGIDAHKRKLHNTGLETKRENWHKFASLIENQFKHGGEKYLLENQKDKEFTDLVCEISPGKTGFDWILQTCVKYVGRYINFQRERDLLKIATYCYIAWLKAGHHVEEEHDEDTRSQKKDVEEMTEGEADKLDVALGA
jgi:hypothetical protein